ncbi:MAG: hypothetical protein A2622_04010 [Bdellovibrionales bacterium RIFCSPHIGHO2_01_FULL_40_29]|nr:MAG: hypothetical protein A2622_04010 [Bdellovibrionales bacterium RIFCSPHIGHO2_01_FULL_40_29]OFZ35324.1 MAG: hypothetical protein A3D17_08020 [Bdellovibrionales bacterium RIFCSPHIGHO2_02_FULL_40_15]
MNQATGKFQVKGTPVELDSVTKQIGAMRMSFDKTFEGVLNATSVVAMMGIMDQSTGSGAYVALEKIDGELASKKGSFCLAHSSSMNRGIPKQSITVVPGSGTNELVGLSGSMEIEIKDGQHFYSFTYSFE